MTLKEWLDLNTSRRCRLAVLKSSWTSRQHTVLKAFSASNSLSLVVIALGKYDYEISLALRTLAMFAPDSNKLEVYEEGCLR